MTLTTPLKACLILCVILACVSGVQAALTVQAGPDQTVNIGDTVTVNAVYNDTAATNLGNRSATINWTVAELPGTITADDMYNGTVTGTYSFSVAGTYAVTVNVTNVNDSTSGNDTLLVTVNETVTPAIPIGTTKIVPRTLNMKSNGIMTVFLTLGEGWANVTNGSIGRSALSRDMVTFLGATPVRINFCMKDGGTFILKFRRQDLNLEGVKDNLTVSGNITTENGSIPFTGSDTVRVKNADANKEKHTEESDMDSDNAQDDSDDLSNTPVKQDTPKEHGNKVNANGNGDQSKEKGMKDNSGQGKK